MKTFKTIDAYIASFPKEGQIVLKKLRAAIKKIVPNAEEKISYGLATYVLQGNLVHFGGYASYVGFYPAPSGLEAFKKEILKYQSSKATLQFPLDKPLPLGLIQKIVKFRVKENTAKVQAKFAKRGIHTEFHQNGTLWAKGKMVDGLHEGRWEWFRKDGTRMRSGNFKKGIQVGTWTTYDKNGKVYKVTQMKK